MMQDTPTAITRKFLQANLQVHPDVVLTVLESQDPTLIDAIIKNVPKDALVVLPRHIPGYVNERYEPPLPHTPVQEDAGTEGDAESGKAGNGGSNGSDNAEGESPYPGEFSRFDLPEDIEILAGSPSELNGGAEYTDFAYYFRNRYTKLAKILRGRGEYIPISALTQTVRYRKQQVCIVGMVSEVRNTSKGHRIAVLEDPTDTVNVLFMNPQLQAASPNRDPERERMRQELFAEAERLIPDEVVMIKGTLSDDGNIIYSDTMFRPDIPPMNAPFRSKEPAKAVFISDVHVGSNTFLKDEWERFSDWLVNCGAKYLLIAGDVVDGIGIYPDQDKELTIPNIYRQYEVFAGMLQKLPRDMRIIVSPGNHDAIRGSEPQPALTEIFTKHFPPNVTLVENPALVSIHGVRVLMYHGRSYDDLIAMIPGASYNEPQNMMEEMLKRRLLACTYGERTPIFPAKEDKLVIDPIPEILHTGHVHITGYKKYHGVTCINAGTWQSQTSFQKQMNINPNPARAFMIDLKTLSCELYDFSGESPTLVKP